MSEKLNLKSEASIKVEQRFPRGCIVMNTRLPLIGKVTGYLTSSRSTIIDLLAVDDLKCYEEREDQRYEKGRNYQGGNWTLNETQRISSEQIRALDPENVTGYNNIA